MLEKVREVLERSYDRDSFFRIVASIYPTLDRRYKIIEKAYNDAKEAFQGQYRDSGERYFEHLRAVALIVILYLRIRDYRLIVVALLHDIVEDCPEWTIERVIKEYGEEIAELVEWTTKPKETFPQKEDYIRIYHERFTVAPREFFLVKIPDRLHNLLTMWSLGEEHIRKKIEETKRYYLHYAEKHFILIHELEAIIDELEAHNEKQKDE